MWIPIVAIVMVFGSGWLAIWTEHQRKMVEMKLKMQNQGDASLRAEVEALRQELRALRDTSTQYDLSFDTALQRMEKRMEAVERRSDTGTNYGTVNLGSGR